MYENLIEFLLGRKEELTEDDVNEFMELLVKALDVSNEYEALEKQAVIENIVDSVALKDQNERNIISSAIENILEFNEESERTEEEDIFAEKSEDPVPLKHRKLRRGKFSKTEKSQNAFRVAESNAVNEDKNMSTPKRTKKEFDRESQEANPEPSQIFAKDTEKTVYPQFDFEIGDLDENHKDGPSFPFRLD